MMAVNIEGVMALKKMASKALSSYQELKHNTRILQSVSESQADTLGPHKSTLDFALNEVLHQVDRAYEPLMEIGTILIKVSQAYQEILNNDRYRQLSHGMTPSSKSSIGYGNSSFGSIGAESGLSGGAQDVGAGNSIQGNDSAARTSANIGGSQFGSFDVASVDGDFMVKGDNYKEYNEIVSEYGGTTYESYGANARVESVSPSKIEGIRLGATEMKENNFWGRRDPSYTRESFVEIASHIPEVRSRIAAGQSLEEIKENPNLAKCAEIYFEPSNITQVVQIEGFYELNNNGRHRVLAARELGYDIPVRIVGRKIRR